MEAVVTEGAEVILPVVSILGVVSSWTCPGEPKAEMSRSFSG